MLIHLDIKILHLQIVHKGGNLEVKNIEIHPHRGKDVLCRTAVFICNLLQGPNIYIS